MGLFHLPLQKARQERTANTIGIMIQRKKYFFILAAAITHHQRASLAMVRHTRLRSRTVLS